MYGQECRSPRVATVDRCKSAASAVPCRQQQSHLLAVCILLLLLQIIYAVGDVVDGWCIQYTHRIDETDGHILRVVLKILRGNVAVALAYANIYGPRAYSRKTG